MVFDTPFSTLRSEMMNFRFIRVTAVLNEIVNFGISSGHSGRKRWEKLQKRNFVKLREFWCVERTMKREKFELLRENC